MPAKSHQQFPPLPPSKGTTRFVELWAAGSKLPAAIALAVENAVVKVDQLHLLPPLGRNPKMAFSFDLPVDQVRLGEAIAILKGLGFVVQRIVAEQKLDEFALISITVGQIQDPRVKP